jgi:hypothetical protein
MTESKNKNIKIVEPTIKKGSTLTASVRDLFNSGVDKVINATADLDKTNEDLAVLVQNQLNANKLVKNKKVDIEVTEEGTKKTVKKMRTVIPHVLWGEYLELIEYRQFEGSVANGNLTVNEKGELSEAEHTRLKSQASTTVYRLKLELGTAQDDSKDSKHYKFHWEKSQSKDSLKQDKLRFEAVRDDKTPLLETMVANDCDEGDYENGFAILNGERAKKKGGKVLGKTEQKAIINSIKADQVKADKIPDNEFKVFIKLFKGSTTAKKKEYMVTIHKLV